jgi:Na+-transporting NADH:ubiquinone oxidoreductase subunit C
MVILVAAILSVAAINLKPFQARNVEIEKKQNILASVNIETSASDAEEIYSEKIVSSYLVNVEGENVEGDAFNVDLQKERMVPLENRRFPIFECNIEGGVKYILPMRGAGLWGPIWGYVSMDEDLNTIYGASFDHAGETPGLGAEISTKNFQQPFKGKKIFDENGALISITVAKSNETAPASHKVDAISGGTITSKGLQNMLSVEFNHYKAFFLKHK